ncbi:MULTISPECIES: RBBP9/YdeN family alpha/beta hydrolase [unclassified Kitasatospora]|uniref:RBBP9/YdeN family alpha/beta hydrolase n=1 Tax=unclassified Kitasatospora TaxID=2633591 RepID=UPI0038023040
MEPVTFVHLAGIGNSGPGHWQHHWHAADRRTVWVEHDSWDHPDRDAWVADLDATLRGTPGPKLIVAHSLGCTTLIEWAADHADPDVTGALLVAAPDPHGPAFPAEATGYHHPRPTPLPFRTLLVASGDDPYATPAHARATATALGADLVEAGDLGHINAASHLGAWPEGRRLLTRLLPPTA